MVLELGNEWGWGGGAVFEVAMVAADTFELKVAASPFSSPRMPLISGHKWRVN